MVALLDAGHGGMQSLAPCALKIESKILVVKCASTTNIMLAQATLASP